MTNTPRRCASERKISRDLSKREDGVINKAAKPLGSYQEVDKLICYSSTSQDLKKDVRMN